MSNDLPTTFTMYRACIEKLRRTIVMLSLHGQQQVVVEKDGFGLMTWCSG